MTSARLHGLIIAVADAVIAHEQEFTTLDQAIGDGDHGLNMRRGADAVRRRAGELAGKSLPEALTAIGNQLVATIGGASGPLYGTLLLALGRELTPDGANFPQALSAALAAVMARPVASGTEDHAGRTRSRPTLGHRRRRRPRAPPGRHRR